MRALFLISITFFVLPVLGKFISMGPAITETLFAVGMGKKVIGVSQYCKYPKDVARIAKVGTPFTPDLEKIVSLAPEIVFTQNLSDKSFQNKIRKLGLKVQTLSFDRYGDVIGSIKKLGNIAKNRKAYKLLKQFQNAKEELQDLKLRGHALVVIEVKVKQGKVVEVMSASPKTYLGEVVEMSGLKVKHVGRSYSYYPLEKLLLNPPDYLYLLKTPLRERELLKKFMIKQGLKKVRVVSLNSAYANIPGPRLVNLMRDIYEYHRSK